MRRLVYNEVVKCVASLNMKLEMTEEEFNEYHKKIKVRCSCGNVYNTRYSDIKRGHKCPKCGYYAFRDKMLKWSLDDIKTIAEAHNCTCLSDKYYNVDNHYKLQCNTCKTVFNLSLTYLLKRKNKEICPSCMDHKRITKDDIINKLNLINWNFFHAINNNEYVVICPNGHKQIKKKHNIIYGEHLSCYYCNIIKKKESIKMKRKKELQFKNKPAPNLKTYNDCKILAERKGFIIDIGEHKLTDCINIKKTHFILKCADQHEWETSYSNLYYNKSGCPYCKNSNERICRVLLEYMLNCKLSTAHPEWLKYKSKRPLELDGYNQKKRIAFEYQGLQHYNISVFSKTIDDFISYQERDKYKAKKCKEKGVVLIIIPPFPERTSFNEKYLTIKKLLSLLNVEYKLIPECKLSELEIKASSKGYLDKVKKICKERNGKLITKSIFTTMDPIIIRCGVCNRTWKTNLQRISNGGWCRHCAHHTLSFGDIKLILDENNIIYQTTNYTNNRQKINLTCQYGHQYQRTAKEIRAGYFWCPICKSNSRGNKTSPKAIADATERHKREAARKNRKSAAPCI